MAKLAFDTGGTFTDFALLDDKGELRRFVNIYLNGDDIRFLNQLNSQVKDGDDISIVPAIAGGE